MLKIFLLNVWNYLLPDVWNYFLPNDWNYFLPNVRNYFLQDATTIMFFNSHANYWQGNSM